MTVTKIIQKLNEEIELLKAKSFDFFSLAEKIIGLCSPALLEMKEIIKKVFPPNLAGRFSGRCIFIWYPHALTGKADRKSKITTKEKNCNGLEKVWKKNTG